MARKYPYMKAKVAWSDADWEFIRGWREGLPLVSWGWAPRDKLATYRQLRRKGLRPGGHEPVAIVYFRCRKALKETFAYLYLIKHAVPVRPMTPAKRAAIEKALAARRTCRQCRVDQGVELAKAHRTCDPCRYELDLLEPDDYLHELLDGEATFSPAELETLPTLADWASVVWTNGPAAVEAARILEEAA